MLILRFIHRQYIFTMTGTVAQIAVRSLCNREAVALIHGRDITTSLKMVLAVLSLGVQHYDSRPKNPNWSAR